MLFDLFLTTKVSIKIEYPNKILLFIENLCFCSLKIAVRVLKITIESKNCRLKITEWSKNYGLKIPNSHQGTRPGPAHQRNTTTGTPPPEKERNTGKPEYICMIADDEKKYKKS